MEEGEVISLGRLSHEGQQLKDEEESFFLNRVPYDVFWGKVKLIGYTMQLRPDHMRLIAPSINLNYEKDIMAHRRTTAKALLCDEGFGFTNGLHDPQKLLLTGFLYCKFSDELSHMDNLWHLINPNFKNKVSLRVIEATLRDLLYVSIDQRIPMVENDQNAANLIRFLE